MVIAGKGGLSVVDIFFTDICKVFHNFKTKTFVNLNNLLKYSNNIFTMFLYISCIHVYNSMNENNLEYVSV